jgi:hypothetical protein
MEHDLVQDDRMDVVRRVYQALCVPSLTAAVTEAVRSIGLPV